MNEEASLNIFLASLKTLRRWLVVGLILASLSPALGFAASHGPETTPALANHDRAAHKHNVVGVRAMHVTMVAEGHTVPWEGVGALYERTVIEGVLEIELSAAMLFRATSLSIPLELLFKAPLHVNDDVVLHAGAGPMVNFIQGEGHGVFPGAVMTADICHWFSNDLGILMESNYTLNWEHGEIVHEIEMGLGGVYRF